MALDIPERHPEPGRPSWHLWPALIGAGVGALLALGALALALFLQGKAMPTPGAPGSRPALLVVPTVVGPAAAPSTRTADVPE